MPDVCELTPTEFCGRWPGGEREGVTLLDVRDPMELSVASIADTVHIPMMQIPGRLGEVDRDGTVVVMCHTGIRSRQVAAFLSASGFKDVFNLTGGIDAWSQEVDATIPRY